MLPPVGSTVRIRKADNYANNSIKPSKKIEMAQKLIIHIDILIQIIY